MTPRAILEGMTSLTAAHLPEIKAKARWYAECPHFSDAYLKKLVSNAKRWCYVDDYPGLRGESQLKVATVRLALELRKTQPTTAQLFALITYANGYGRTWRSQLKRAWLTGRAEAELQEVLDLLGPSWLKRFKLPQVDIVATGNPAHPLRAVIKKETTCGI